MEKILKKLEYLFLISIFSIIILYYFFVYKPLKNELKTSLIANFKHIVAISEINLENYFQKCIEGTNSLSSRTMIRKKLYDYYNNKINLKYLKDYTQPKYIDGAKALKNIVGALRISKNNNLIAKYGKIKKYNIENFNNKTTDIRLLNNNKIVVSSPIYENKTLLGYDIASFSLYEFVKKISKPNINLKLIPNPSHKKTLIVTNSEIIMYKQILETDIWLKTTASKNIYYDTLNKISIHITVLTLLTLIAIIFVFKFVIENTTKKVINNLENKNKKIEYLSFHDKLTGLYNRRYFEDEMNRLNNSRKLPISIIIADIDDFKLINDRYGHKTGDNYLKKAANIFKEATRSDDIIARIGGDEFAIILPNTNKNNSQKISERILEYLEHFNKKEKTKTPLNISTGCATMKKENQNLEYIMGKADKKMYENKTKKNQ